MDRRDKSTVFFITNCKAGNEYTIYFENHVVKIFDKTFSGGKLPAIWKDANMLAIYKTRKIKVTPSTSPHLWEKTVRTAILNHINKSGYSQIDKTKV